ncbi:MAG TPA: S9 family peptidase [Terriglobales bacterium]|nr:S9 family peptidase [Terriglobales bacterium]
MSIVLTQSAAAADQMTSAPKPPVAKKVPHVTEIHNMKLVDDYFWLRDKPNPDVRAYIEAENAYTDAVMKPTAELQRKLYEEMLSRIKETDVNVPYREGDYYYYSRTEKGKQYPILARKKGSVEAPEEIVLDVNKLAEGHTFMSVGAFRPSPDGNLLAYSTDNTGFRQYTMQVKDLRTGNLLPDKVEKTGSVVWANDNKTLFYTVEDAAKRQYRLYRHKVGTTGPDDLIYEEKDERFVVHAEKSRSEKYIFLVSSSHTTSEVRYLPADAPTSDLKTVAERVQGVEYYPDHNGDHFYFRVNDTGRTFRLVKAPVLDPSKKNWVEVVAMRPEVMLDDVEFFKDFYVSHERENALVHIRITDLRNGESHRVQFPEPAYSVFPEANRVFDTHEYRYRYQSFITSSSVFDYDVEKRTAKLLKQTEVLGGYDPKRYTVERVYATAADGMKVPISLVYLKSVKKDGTAPIYLYAYGSYGMPMDVGFNSNRFSLIDRGAVYAIAHIRGGGDLGKAWHDDGKMMKKKNTFTDFITAAEYLLAQKYGSKDRLVIEGGSAGGLLMGAVTNMRPDLFKAVISKVPFVDVINTMLDETLPLTIGEFEEWGNPKKKDEFDYMYSYSPYDQLRKGAYPSILVKTSFNDSQVMYWEPAKYVAKLRTLKTDQNPLLLKTNMGAGHGGASGRYDYLHEVAFDYAFALTQMGAAGPVEAQQSAK